ncbi:MAG: DUF2059 domain-containing protein [Rhodomicrobium sp.]
MPSFTRFLIIGLFMAVTAPALAVEDTPQNREQEANRYLKAASPESMMAEVSNKLAATLPPEQRAPFISMMTKHLDMGVVVNATRQAMIKTFTADELHALADFYASPVGKSAMSKMGDYMAAVMPVLMKEIQTAAMKAQEEIQQPK